MSKKATKTVETVETVDLESMKKEISIAISAFNETVANGIQTKADLTALEDKISYFNEQAELECYRECKEHSSSPVERMKFAAEKLRFEVLKLSDNKKAVNADTGFFHKSSKEGEKPIDICKLQEYCQDSGGIGFDPEWDKYISKLMLMMTAWQLDKLRIDPIKGVESVNMIKLAEEFDFDSVFKHRTENPNEERKAIISNAALTRALRDVTNALIEEKGGVKGRDLEFFKAVFSKKGRAKLSVALANDKAAREYIMEICHRILLNEKYVIEVKSKKL